MHNGEHGCGERGRGERVHGERGRAERGRSVGREGDAGRASAAAVRAMDDTGRARAAAGRATGDGAPSAAAGDPAPTRADYARYARQSVEEIARDCEVQVFRATGPGGQGVNTTDSAVRMRHAPTGVVVVSRASRSQLQNRQECLRKLAAIFERRSQAPKKRVKTKVPHAQKERRLKAKRLASQKKAQRRAPRDGDGW